MPGDASERFTVATRPLSAPSLKPTKPCISSQPIPCPPGLWAYSRARRRSAIDRTVHNGITLPGQPWSTGALFLNDRPSAAGSLIPALTIDPAGSAMAVRGIELLQHVVNVVLDRVR